MQRLELVAKARMEAAVADKLEVMARSHVFELVQERAQVREEAREKRERLETLLSKMQTKRILVPCAGVTRYVPITRWQAVPLG